MIAAAAKNIHAFHPSSCGETEGVGSCEFSNGLVSRELVLLSKAPVLFVMVWKAFGTDEGEMLPLKLFSSQLKTMIELAYGQG